MNTEPYPKGDPRNDEYAFYLKEEKRLKKIACCRRLKKEIDEASVLIGIGAGISGGIVGWYLLSEDTGSTIISHCPFCGSVLPKVNKYKGKP